MSKRIWYHISVSRGRCSGRVGEQDHGRHQPTSFGISGIHDRELAHTESCILGVETAFSEGSERKNRRQKAEKSGVIFKSEKEACTVVQNFFASHPRGLDGLGGNPRRHEGDAGGRWKLQNTRST